MEIITGIFILQILLLLLCIFLLIRASNKIGAYEESMEKLSNDSQELITQYERWILSYRTMVNEAFDIMHEADLRGAFESDDEVGNAFKAIKAVVDDLQKFTVETIVKTENIEEKK